MPKREPLLLVSKLSVPPWRPHWVPRPRLLHRAAQEAGARLLLCPELCITAYSCGDLFFQPLLLENALVALQTLAEATASAKLASVVGLPFAVDGKLYNCAALLADGQVVGLVPKSFLPSTGEFYEERWFTPAACAADVPADVHHRPPGQSDAQGSRDHGFVVLPRQEPSGNSQRHGVRETMKTHRPEAGFTIVEAVTAIFVFSLIIA
ncbi:MAG: hypothetical protein HGA45_11035, partial [Chloroflexales bacterium]|nr:hypothetical protein [Chloroflexales bacterium]